jgi:hypothetical protein
MTTQTTTQTHTQTITPSLSGPVASELTFFVDPEDGAVPYNFVHDPPEGQPKSNYQVENHSVVINDIRTADPSVTTLDTSGFAVHSNVSSKLNYDDWENDEVIKSTYYPEVEKLLLEKVPGAQKVVFFDHTVRRTRPNAEREPVTRAHIDQTPKAAKERVALHSSSPEETAERLKGRYRLINIWRPIQTTPVKAFPLAMADSRTVKSEDLVPVEHRYPHRTGETAGVRFAEGQQWWYFSEMTGEDRIFLQCFDSKDGVEGEYGSRVAHTAFKDPRSPVGEGRESIEVRTLVYGDL